jgi:hypothetical protein
VIGKELAVAHLRYDEWFQPFDLPRILHPFVSDGIEEPWKVDHGHYFPEGEGVEEFD